MKTKISPFIIAVILLIIFAGISRFIPHPYNFTAVGAIALFAGANIREKKLAFLVPILVLFITDLFLGMHSSLIPVYFCFAFTVGLGILIRNNQHVLSVIGTSLISSVVFYLITNLPFWYLDLKLYPMTLSGTIQSYQAALPFFKNQLLGDLFYNLLIFSVYSLSLKTGATFFRLNSLIFVKK
jgi:hypothetical protein